MEEEYHDKFENQVNHIVDHHHDNELYHLNIIKDRVIVKVGSACTLVTNLMVEKLDNLNEEEKAEFAMFISAPICIDTYLFKPDLKGNKWTEDDSKAFQLLQNICPKLQENPSEYWRTLYDQKSDIKHNLGLGARAILQKDFKKFKVLKDDRNVGIAATLVPLEQFIKHFKEDEVLKVMQSLMKDLNLGLFMIKTRSESNGVYSKEILLYADSAIMSYEDTKCDDLKANMESQEEWKLSLQKEYRNTENQKLITWNLGNPQIGRKDMDKLIKEFYKENL